MIEFALTMSSYASVLYGRDLNENKDAKEFNDLAECYARQMDQYLLNESLNRYADYVNMQPVPVLSQSLTSLGELAESVEWREDL